MDRALMVSLLQAAEDRVANGEQDITDQVDIISTLKRTGHAPTSATVLLGKLKQAQLQHVADRDRLRAELTALDARETAKPVE